MGLLDKILSWLSKIYRKGKMAIQIAEDLQQIYELGYKVYEKFKGDEDVSMMWIKLQAIYWKIQELRDC